ncbi:MAG: ABC transporter substrate-binding protein, partial [Dehalococcoidia bacterium]
STIHRAVGLVYNRLLKWNWGPETAPSSTDIVPDLVESFEQPDETTTVFTFRNNVSWQNRPPVNGRAFGASDVKATFDRILSPELKSQLAGRFAGELASLEASDDRTVVTKLTQPYAEFLHSLAFHFYWIVPRELIETDQLKSNPVGTGPFIMERWDKGQKIVFQRNPTYWKQGKPHLDGVEYLLIRDNAATLSSFASGQVDSISDVDAENLTAIKAQIRGAQVQEFATWVTRRLQVTPTRPPLNDPRVRLAILKMVDQQQVNDLVSRGGSFVGPLPHQWGDYGLPEDQARQLLKVDLAEAKKLLDAAGYDYEQTLEMSWNQGYGKWYESAALILQQQLEKGGVKTRITSYPQAEYLARWRPPFDKNQLTPAPLTGNSPELLYTAYNPRGEYYFQPVDDQRLLDMIERQRRILDTEERAKYVIDIQRYLLTENIIDIPLGLPALAEVVQPKVRNYFFHLTFGAPYLEDASFA